MNPYERIHRIALIAAIMLAIMFILALRSHGQEQQVWANCRSMPHTTDAERQARNKCFTESNAREDAKHKAITYTIALYTPNETKTWIGRDLLSLVDGLEFTDSASGHRIRIFGAFTVESSTDEISASESEE